MSLLLLGVGGATFSPLNLGASLIRWHYPSNLSSTWQDSARTTQATSNNDPIGALDDLSGNGRHFLQVTSGNRMSLLLNHYSAFHAVASDNVDDSIFDATYNEVTNEIWYIVADIKREGSAGVGQNIMATTQRLVFEQGSNNTYEQFGGATRNSGIAVPASFTKKIIKSSWAGASSRVSIHDGTSWTDGIQGNAGTNIGTDQLIGIGGGQPKNTLKYLEIVCVTSITAPQEAALVTYLSRLGVS